MTLGERFPEALERAINELSKLPTIGRKSAQRLAFHLLKLSHDRVYALADSLRTMKSKLDFCPRCFYISESGLCAICRDPNRNGTQICVVEEAPDVASFERAGSYRGVYHVLLGHLSPLHGVSPEDLKISELIKRVEDPENKISEVVLATNPNLDGDATALYLAKLIEPLGIRISRLGLGLSIGSSLEYADELTLLKAFESRKQV